MKKSKVLKSLGFTSLALLIGVAGAFAFTPLCAQNPQLAKANTIDKVNTKADGKNIKYAPSPLGLDPENDPVIYTTESGLEIKFGGAATALGGGNETMEYDKLTSGKPLSGYPYFTMGTYSGYAVNWVIIGKSTTMPSSIVAQTYDTLANWQNKTSESPTYKNWFNNQYEIDSPAGTTIKNNNILNNYTARKITNPLVNLASLPAKSEISDNCVLVISECTLGTSIFKSYSTTSASNCDYEVSTLKTNINNLYNSGLSLTTAQKNMIVAQTLTNAYTSKNVANTSSGSVYNSTSANQKLFVFTAMSDTSITAVTKQNFSITNYLTSNSLRIAYKIGTTTKIRYWLRAAERHCNDSFIVKLDGSISFGGTVQTGDMTYVPGDPTASSGTSEDVNNDDVMGMRPCAVIKLQ